MGQIVTKKEFGKIRKQIKTENKTIAHCHGVFDLVHPGHLQHFMEARKLADVLIVTVTAARFVRKGPDRPFFDDDMRLSFLAAIECIDYVMLSEGYTGEDVIEIVQPDYWVKGQEYADIKNDVTQAQEKEVALVKKYGGDVCFTSGVQFSSSRLINKALAPFSEELQMYIESLQQDLPLSKAVGIIDKFKELSILVIGDTIIDEYIYCSPPGSMTKSNGYSTSVLRRERSLGGALAIARHASAFCGKTSAYSIIGKEVDVHEEIEKELDKKIENCLILSENFDTIIKTKYLVENVKREELNKLFSVNNIKNPAIVPEDAEEALLNKLKEDIDIYDLVICCDFGHGLVTERILRFLEENAKYFVINCQTNATNYGLNLITKCQRVDAFVLNQKELKLAMQTDKGTEEDNLKKLRIRLGAKEGWLTRGAHGAYGVKDKVISCPAVSNKVKDTIGAGDAFLTMAAMGSAIGEDIEISTFLGNVAGALGANIIGNTKSLERSNVLKFIATLLNI